MGNALGHIKQDLRDRDAEVSLPQNISRINSNFILAMQNGTFFPCIILRPAAVIPEGYVVYFFHLKKEIEIPSNNVIGNFWALVNCEISFVDSLGNVHTGRVIGTDYKRSETSDQPVNFFVQGKDISTWVSFPYIFLTRQQAAILCY